MILDVFLGGKSSHKRKHIYSKDSGGQWADNSHVFRFPKILRQFDSIYIFHKNNKRKPLLMTMN